MPRAVVTATVPVSLDKFHRELIRQLLRRYEVHVVSSPGAHLDRIGRDLDVTVHALEMHRVIAPMSDLLALAAWWRLLRRIRPELVVSATPKASLLGQLSARAVGVPDRLYYVGGLRLEGTAGWRRALLTAMERLTTQSATAVVANSASLARRLRQLRLVSEAKLHRTAPGSSHGVDTEHFLPRAPDLALARSLGMQPDVPVVGFVGRLTRDKGIDVLVAAAEQVQRRGLALQVLVIGPTDEPDSQASLRCLESARVPVFIGGVVDDVRPYLSLVDVHALPSHREGFPNVVLEAAAMAVPTVTTNATGAVDSVLPGRTGLVAPVADVDAFADALFSLLEDRGIRARMGAEARAWVVSCFQPAQVVRSLLRPVVAGEGP